MSIGITLLIAGHETTANRIALSTLVLLRNPPQLAALRKDPSQAPAAVEELLRYLSVGLYTRIPTLRVAVPFEEIRFKDNTLVYGVTALPVTW